jgi:hypothetical protein
MISVEITGVLQCRAGLARLPAGVAGVHARRGGAAAGATVHQLNSKNSRRSGADSAWPDRVICYRGVNLARTGEAAARQIHIRLVWSCHAQGQPRT